ncbi:MAG: FAD-dependent oxidoreductase [Hyphomicrobiales bacterium]|nr:FAD-dependent oxidoreductase [Hyphomicrobiales bacterium]
MQKVVVVGGGIAGIVSATHLARRLKGDAAEIILVDHTFAHLWKPMLHTFAAGTASDHERPGGHSPDLGAPVRVVDRGRVRPGIIVGAVESSCISKHTARFT